MSIVIRHSEKAYLQIHLPQTFVFARILLQSAVSDKFRSHTGSVACRVGG